MSNLQKAFKNKARFGLRMAAGGLLSGRGNSTEMIDRMEANPDAFRATRSPGFADTSVANLGMSQGLSGAWSMDAGSANPAATPAVAKPEGLRAAQPPAPTVAPPPTNPFYKPGTASDPHASALPPTNPFYKPGTASDPHASALPVAAPRPVVAAAAAPAQNNPTPNMMTPVEELLPSRQGLRLANGGILPVAGVIRNRVAQVDEAVDEAVNGAATPATAAPVAPVDDIDAAVQADMARRAAAREAAKPKGFLKRLGFADGGVIETPDELMARMAKKYGGNAASVVRPQQTPTPVVVAPAPAAKPAGGGLGGAIRDLRGRKAQIDEAAGFAEGGIVRGKGGVDNVPMTINGVDVNLTGGKAPEAVLPSKTVQALGGPEAVEELIERTNGKPPVRSGLREGGRYAGGVLLSDPDAYNSVRRPPEPAPAPAVQVDPVLQRAAAARKASYDEMAADTARREAASAEATARAAAQKAKAPGSIGEVTAKYGRWANADVGNAVSAGLRKVAPAVKPVGKALGYATRGLGKAVAPVSAAIDATDVYDVVQDPNKTKLDVANEVAHKSGNWASAGLGSVAGAKAGAALGLLGGPFAEITVPAGAAIGALGGGVAGYMGSEKLMEALGSKRPSATTVGGTSEFKRDLNRRVFGGQQGTHIMSPEEVANMKVVARSTPRGAKVQDMAPEGWATQDFAQEAADLELGARVLGPNAAVPQGLRASTDASGGRRLDFTSTNNAANDSMNQGLRKTNGEGVASMRQKDGTFKNIVLGASPTKWTDGPEYKAAMEQNAKDKLTLRDMEHARIKRTAAMPGATQGDLVALADQEKSDALYNDQIKNQNDMAYRQQDLGLRRDQNWIAQQNIIADNQRANAAARALRDKEVRAEVNEHLKNAATGSDGRVDGTKLAWLERAGASVGDTNPDIDPSLFAQKKINHALALRWINDSGFLPNWIKGNLEQDNFTVPNLVEEGDEWVDKGTGQSFSKSSLKKAPLAIQRAIKEMSEVYKKDAATK